MEKFGKLEDIEELHDNDACFRLKSVGAPTVT
jgi:hypothetical protein